MASRWFVFWIFMFAIRYAELPTSFGFAASIYLLFAVMTSDPANELREQIKRLEAKIDALQNLLEERDGK